MKAQIDRTIIARFDLLGNTDSGFNKGIGFTLGTGLGATIGCNLGLSNDHICVSGLQRDDSPKNNFFALKLNQRDGSFYTPFGGIGLCVRPLPDTLMGIISSVGVQLNNDGSVVLGGRMRSGNGGPQPAVFVRLTDRGVFDHYFGNNGVILSPQNDAIYGFVSMPNDTIIAGVGSDIGSNKLRFIKCDPEPQYFEVSFNTQSTLIPRHITYFEDQIYIAGNALTNKTFGYFISRLDSTGKQDRSFGNEGLCISHFNTDAVVNVLRVAHSGIHLAGNAPGKDNTLVLARHKFNGDPDKTFSGDGKRVVSFEYINELHISDVAVSTDGTIYLGGKANKRVFLAAFKGNGDTFVNFGENSNQIEPGTLLFDRFDRPDSANPSTFECKALALTPDGNHLVICGYSSE